MELDQQKDSNISLQLKHLRIFLAIWICTSSTYASDLESSGLVSVNGTELHYRDWGNHENEKVILMLTGYGNTANVFESFAKAFLSDYRVLALTRRGFGESKLPSSDCSIEVRTEDILQFLDTIGVKKVHLFGHSMAGDELTEFASRYPSKVSSLVYLDSAFDRSLLVDMPLGPYPDPGNIRTRALLEAKGSPDANELVSKPEDFPYPITEEEIAFRLNCQRSMIAYKPDYRKLKAPSLAFYSTPNLDTYLNFLNQFGNPSFRVNDPSIRKKIESYWPYDVEFRQKSISQFRTEAHDSSVYEMPHADHYLFLDPFEEEVASVALDFLKRIEESQ